MVALVAGEVFAAGELLWAAGSISASLAGGLTSAELRLPARESARALMRKQSQGREDKGTYAMVPCGSISASLVGGFVTSGGFLHLIMRAKTKQEEGTYAAVSCCSVSVLLVWSRAAVSCTRARVLS